MALSGQGGQSDRRHIWERKRESLQSSLACFVIPDPILNSDPRPHQRSVMRGSCLTQNGAWFKSQKERDIHRVGKRERKRELHRTQRTHLSSLSLSLDCSFFFFLSFCFLFCFHCTETVALSSYTSPLFLSVFPPPIFSPSSGCFWTTACHHQRPPPQVRIQGGEDQQDSGREFVRRGFNEIEASSAGEKCMQMICTHQKDPG